MSRESDNEVKRFEVIFLAFVYGLHVIVITAPLGFAIAAYKVRQFKRLTEMSTAGLANQETVLIATHYQWLMRTVIVAGLMMMAAVGLAYYFVGFIIGGIAAVWWFYRLVRGAMALTVHHMTLASICTQAICYGQIQSD